MAQQKSTRGELKLFAVYLDSGQQPKAFTVRDAGNGVLQNG